MAKLVLSDTAYGEIQDKKKIARITHMSYDQVAKKADEMIEKNHQGYVATYKRATLYYAR